jgi:hypothetical protein
LLLALSLGDIMKTEITMSPEELADIKSDELQRGFDMGVREMIEQFYSITLTPHISPMVFHDDRLMEKYRKLKAILEKLCPAK